MTLWRWLAVAALVATVVLLLLAHSAGVTPWTLAAGAVAAVAALSRARRADSIPVDTPRRAVADSQRQADREKVEEAARAAAADRRDRLTEANDWIAAERKRKGGG